MARLKVPRVPSGESAGRSAERQPPPPPATWRVTIEDFTFEVIATFALVSTNGVLVFRDADGQLIKAFAHGHWSLAEMVRDRYGNSLVGPSLQRSDGEPPRR